MRWDALSASVTIHFALGHFSVGLSPWGQQATVIRSLEGPEDISLHQLETNLGLEIHVNFI